MEVPHIVGNCAPDSADGMPSDCDRVARQRGQFCYIFAPATTSLILKESLLGLITGLLTDVVAGAVAALWFENLALGLIVAMGMLVCRFFAGLAGASIPISMKALGFDPAQCSNIILTSRP